MKRLSLKWPKKPDEKVDLDKGSVMVATHKGDINYLRYVKFKQLAPQFWEKMDSPLFAVYMEKFMDLHNKGKYAQSVMALHDYKMAIDQAQGNHEAWGMCFALICYEKGEKIEDVPNDVELKDKLDRLTKQGLTPDLIEEHVVNFMKASPGTFQDHLILYAAQNLMTGTDLSDSSQEST